MKRLVICCDGTWNSADQEHDGEPCPTNVVRFAYRVAKKDRNGVSQIVFYDQGVGTGNTIDKVTGGAIGRGLEENIHDAYRFLFANYEEGDELFVLGFSRGAFTARSVVGMIRKCGVLDRTAARMYRGALDLYRNEETPDQKGPTEFREKYCLYKNRPIEVKFVGVWDTVGALGIPLRGLRWLTNRDKYQFHDTELSGMVKNAYHALAIDEHRKPFEPAVWQYQPKSGQHVEQVWFAGAHSDVGGGYERDKAKGWTKEKPLFEPQLADISLAWMMEKAQERGLEFDHGVIEKIALCEEPGARIHDSMTGLYNLVPKFDRVIGLHGESEPAPKLDPTQAIHKTVLERWDNDPKYRPVALKRYFERIGDPRGKVVDGVGVGRVSGG
jgi:uncharacterized protein (DUF2235 family)